MAKKQIADGVSVERQKRARSVRASQGPKDLLANRGGALGSVSGGAEPKQCGEIQAQEETEEEAQKINGCSIQGP
jgi:hypothetical protein